MDMSFDLSMINERIRRDAAGFVRECDAVFHDKIKKAADLICNNIEISPVVLLSGPSGSGKTTTSLKLQEELTSRGIASRGISMDNYFKTVDLSSAPRTSNGEIDYESPLCLDMDLLNEHFDMLNRGEEIQIPHFMFARQKRSASNFTPMKLGKNEVAIFEGIHALNNDLTDRHPEAMNLYISARSNITDDARIVFKGTWLRLVRRVVRDNNFRGADALFTIKMWSNIRRGEKLYISPYKEKASFMLDSAIPYEVSLLKNYAPALFSQVPDDYERHSELQELFNAFNSFETLDPSIVAPDSLLREFIGGSKYKF